MATILAADIGGTNCRLGLFRSAAQGADLKLEKASWLATEDIPHAQGLAAAFRQELDLACAQADMVVVALAGPVLDGARGRLSNGSLELDFAALNQASPQRRPHFALINDFMAQAYAALSPQGEAARHVAGPAQGRAHATRAVIGAGTGLGQAILAPQDDPPHWLALPSENGHAAFPFAPGAESDFHAFLCQRLRLPFASGDDTITGRGLPLLHEFLTGEKLSPAQVGAQALGRETATLTWYARFYGRACRDWMLATMCQGGLWIAGGIAAQNPLVVTCRHFCAELSHAPEPWGAWLGEIPVYLLEDTNSGLWGAAIYGLNLLAPRA